MGVGVPDEQPAPFLRRRQQPGEGVKGLDNLVERAVDIRWSASMLPMLATVGRRWWNDLLYSHASATSSPGSPACGPVGMAPAPSLNPVPVGTSGLRHPAPSCRHAPPTITEGSKPASARAHPSIAVVVLLPCVPAMAMPRLPFMHSPRASE